MLSNGQLKTVAVGADQRIPSSELRRLVEEVLNKLPRVLEDVITREEEKRIVFEFADDAAQSAGGSCVLCPGPLEALIRVASSSPKHISRRPLCEWQPLQTSLWQNRVGAIT